MTHYTEPNLLKHFKEVYKRELTKEEETLLDFGFCYGVNYEKHLVAESLDPIVDELHDND